MTRAGAARAHPSANPPAASFRGDHSSLAPGVRLVVEGIEHRAQLDALMALACRWGRGFHFARPTPAAELGAMLASAKNPA